MSRFRSYCCARPRIFEPELVVNRPSRAAISRQASLRGECDNMPNAIVSLKLDAEGSDACLRSHGNPCSILKFSNLIKG
jgi:hypothetical protein